MTDLDRLKPAVARVRDAAAPPGQWLGTAFYVGDGYALSALHVVATPSEGPLSPKARQLTLDFVDAGHVCAASIVLHDVGNDWVVLKCEPPPPVRPVECGVSVQQNDAWLSYGFPSIAAHGLSFEGRVMDANARDPLNPDVWALQLFSDQAAAGLGASMSGFSGSPCMVGDKAVGILRSALQSSVLDGRGAAQAVTVAGTSYACPAAVVVDRWVSDTNQVPLPGAWTARQTSSDFAVVLTGQQRPLEQERLLRVATEARDLLPHARLGAPWPVDAIAAVDNQAALLEAVRLLCRARVVVFDVSGFTPAVMLLLGIRAAVRRGVTILSVGGAYVLGKHLNVPFNLQDANIVSHSVDQERADDRFMRPIPLLAARILRGLSAVDSPFHFDLPVYEAVRRLPATRRGIRAASSGVLVLCSFDAKYVKSTWLKRLKPAFENQLAKLRAQQDSFDRSDDPLGVSRSFELNSPQLVSRAIYEEMRRAQCCVVDLTEWAPTVVFELGVRLAVSPHPTACMIEKSWAERPGLDAGAQRLLQLLAPQALRYDLAEKDYLNDRAYAAAYGPQAALPRSGVAGGAVYRAVERDLDVAHEPAARPVWRELLDASQLFARQTLQGGTTKPVGLFPANRALTDQEEQADFDRLLASVLFIIHRHGEAAALSDTGGMSAALREALRGLFNRHNAKITLLDEALQKRLGELMDKTGVTVVADPFEGVMSLKQNATALRNRRHFDEALKVLDEAMQGLARMRREARGDERLMALIRAELADTHGMKGGIHRRRNDLAAALADYQAGVDTEGPDSTSTYNLGNLVLLSILLSPQRIDDGSLADEVGTLLRRLDEQTQSTRSDEWWAWADLAQFRLLNNDVDGARQALLKGRSTGPSRAEYQRPLEVLDEVAAKLGPQRPGRARQIVDFIAEMRPLV